tara:strand:- start:11 stop:223 length:213 start_codon:yes stop_codon:yes gene_type:complete
MQKDNFSTVIEDLKKKGIQNTSKLFKDIQEELYINDYIVTELIRLYVKTYDIDAVMCWLKTQEKNIEDYK